MSDMDVKRIADKHGVSAATILISYHVCKGVVALPKSVSEKRISGNRQTVALSKDELAELDSLAAEKGKAKRINTPLWGSDLGFSDWYGPASAN
jgi:glycerol 2-dehydrogenase (NADP+)